MPWEWPKKWQRDKKKEKKLNIELPFDPSTLLLGIYLEKTIIQKLT